MGGWWVRGGMQCWGWVNGWLVGEGGGGGRRGAQCWGWVNGWVVGEGDTVLGMGEWVAGG